MDQRGQVEISGDDGHLVRRLIREIEGLAVGAAKQQQPGTGLLIVDGADVQRRVARRILGVHVGSVEEQIFQMLDQSIAARLCHKMPVVIIRSGGCWIQKKKRREMSRTWCTSCQP